MIAKRTTMNIIALPAKQLTPEQVQAWDQLQRCNPTLDSPYFRPEFTRAVAAVRPNVEVAVLEEGGEPVGFFPFQRGRWGVGKPVGGPLSDFQGLIARPDLQWDAEFLLRACRLRAWDFDHLLAGQTPFRAFHTATEESAFIDVSGGFDAYCAVQNRPGHESLRNLQRKARKLAREIGSLRFEMHTTDPTVFTTLLAWKGAQYWRTDVTNVFAFGWTVGLLEQVLQQSRKEFAGVLSALYAGDRLAAVHLGMRSFHVLHGWFPAYDVTLSRYSPGMILLIELLKYAAAAGVKRLDIGRVAGDHKTCFMSGAISIASGSVAPPSLLRTLRTGWRRVRSWARTGPLRVPARLAGRWTRPLRGWLAFR
jgi:CelD/BcsL family acetyltransferase involved in cellulose biosynthesis